MAISTKREHTMPRATSITQIDDEIQNTDGFRPIHYLGSKLRALHVIEKALSDVSPDNSRVIDLFAGSGTVAQYLSKKRPVTAVDIQEYSRVLCSALLLRQNRINPKGIENSIRNSKILVKLNEAVRPLQEYETSALLSAAQGDASKICNIIQSGSLVRKDRENEIMHDRELSRLLDEVNFRLNSLDCTSVITRHYGGLYFSYQQSVFMDAVANYIRNNHRGNIDLLLSVLLSTTSHIVNSVGKQFAQPVKPKTKDGRIKKYLISKIINERSRRAEDVFFDWFDRYSSLSISRYQHRVVRADFMDALNQQDQFVGAVYADPPYTRDHYSRFYHVLETISLDDDPGISTVNIGGRRKFSRGLYREDRYQSPFCIRSQAPGAFHRLIGGVARLDAPLVLSYSPYSETKKSHPRVVTLDQLKIIGVKYYKNYEVRDVDTITHSKLNRNDLNLGKVENSEILLIFTNPY